ncbi:MULTISPECIES: hypothetical protein [Phyllobacteriaceae]|jgi:hypothetical protein|nr:MULTISPECIES: hypothetical protein [Mesorhizobium]MBN9235117.1 hypothetical protein [Mesorhizobium sp.]
MNAHARIPSSVTATLAARAVVVSLHITQWSGRRLDRQITDEVNREHGASADAGRFNKLLLPKEALQPIQSIVSATRAEFDKRTLPWMDGGGRIMNAAAIMANDRWLSLQKQKFMDAVGEFIASYPELVRSAPDRMSGLFKDADYPTVDSLRDRYSMELRKLPVPTPEDFRVSMSEAQADVIRADIERQVREGAATAVRDVYRRVADVAGRMAERLTAYRPAARKGDQTEGAFRDSLVLNVRDLIEVLPMLNITGDPELTAMVDRLRPLAAWDAQVLRENEGVRKDVAAEAKKILDQVSGFLA